ncbi:MAG: tetratricopeptide repeat protein [Candidatus Wallbacteria bacterium]|nr:tetratricopeptide repeat protein [Candidatus Wallbacteria bacterium]
MSRLLSEFYLPERDCILAGASGQAALYRFCEMLLRDTLRDEPGNAAILLRLGILYREQGRRTKALHFVRSALEHSRGSHSTLCAVELADTLQAAGHYRQALDVLEPLPDNDSRVHQLKQYCRIKC